jgi:hypothetical protein
MRFALTPCSAAAAAAHGVVLGIVAMIHQTCAGHLAAAAAAAAQGVMLDIMAMILIVVEEKLT